MPSNIKVWLLYMGKIKQSMEIVPAEAHVLNVVDKTLISYFRYIQRTKGNHVYRTKAWKNVLPNKKCKEIEIIEKN